MKRLAPGEPALLATVFLDLFGFGMLIPDVQLRAEALGARGWLIGSLLASMFVVQFLVSPRWGAVSDRWGRKRVIVACTVLSAAGMALYAFADSVSIIFFSRILAGLGAANVAVAHAFLADATDGESRTAAMGRIGAATTLGLIAGPAIGGHLAAVGGNFAVGLTAAGCSMAGALLVTVALPDVRTRVPASDVSRRPVFDVRLLWDVPRLWPLVAVAVVAWYSLATLEGTFGRLIKHNLGFGQREFGWIFGFESAIAVAIQALALGWLTTRLKEQRLLVASYSLQGLGLILTPLAPTLGFLFLASGLYAMGSGAANPTINSLCSRLTPSDRQGELFGLLQGARSLGFVFGPVLGGMLFDWRPGAPYVLAGAICGAAALLVAVYRPAKDAP